MPAPDLRGEIVRNLKELFRLKDRVLPVKVGRAVQESIRQNFRRGSFYGLPWESPLRSELGFNGPGYGPLLSGTDHLMMSTDYLPQPGRVLIQNNLVYARIHNEGGEIIVTKKMKSFFWSQYYKRGLVGGMYSQAKGTRNRRKAEALNQEAEFWRAMALKKVGSKIRIPQRQFMGEHPELDKLIQYTINQELSNFIRNGITTRRSR